MSERGKEGDRQAVAHGIRASFTLGILDRWPDFVPGYGPRDGAKAFACCVLCGPGDVHPWPARAGTFTHYGGTALCFRHARGLSVEPTTPDLQIPLT